MPIPTYLPFPYSRSFTSPLEFASIRGKPAISETVNKLPVETLSTIDNNVPSDPSKETIVPV